MAVHSASGFDLAPPSPEQRNSGTGWPSFTAPFDDDHLRREHDASYGMVRTELLCARAAATRAMYSATARRPPACATASTPSLWPSRPRASRSPTSSAVGRRKASLRKGDRLAAQRARPANRREFAWNWFLYGFEPAHPVAPSTLDRPRLEGDVFAFKKVIQTCFPAQTTPATLLEAAFFKLVVHIDPIVDPDRPSLKRARHA
jgi:hypothetical protein